MKSLWSIAVDAPLYEPLTYEATAALQPLLKRGARVTLPLGKRKATGIVLGAPAKIPDMALKAIEAIETEYAPLPENFLKWLEWMASYYVYPIGSVAALAYPPLKRQTKERKTLRAPVIPFQERSSAQERTEEQDRVIKDISAHKGFSVHLLFGVTGSGKTEVYLQLLEETLREGKTGMVLVPEIALTPQLIHRFSARFGEQIAVIHSQLTERERTNQWWDVVDGKKKILIGARSALFCPIENLGLIVVDEEHEPSFKQDEKLKYHGRDAAIMLGRFSNCPVLLGSATPSLESWKNALDGRYHLHTMKQRVQSRPLPEVEIVDLRNEISPADLPSWMSPQLFTALHTAQNEGHQSALFLNRRGMAPLVLCQDCGYTYECPNCDINLTLHGVSSLVCHYCDYHVSLANSCPDCKEGELKKVGLGTEQIEQDLRNLFPESRIARADRDEIQNRKDMEVLIADMEGHQIDILVGTQMIAKGLDFPKLKLVGLVLADVGFNLPDFRAVERSFQLITQVSGRAGRHVSPGESPGKVLVQTYNPAHPSLQFALNHDFSGYAKFELLQRQELLYPPFGRLIAVRIQGSEQTKVQDCCRLISLRATQLKKTFEKYRDIEVLGPAEAPLSRLKRQFRFQLLLKGKDSALLHAFYLQLVGDENWVPQKVRVGADVDPMHLL